VLQLAPLLLSAQGTEKAMQAFFFYGKILTALAAINPIVLIVYFITRKNWLLIPLGISTFIALIAAWIMYNSNDSDIALKGKLFFISGILSIVISLWRNPS